ncbi:MAG: hypothetical protein ABJN78_03390 [Hyphomicrobiales bacterium]
MLRVFLISWSYALFFTFNAAAADLSEISKLEGFVSIEETLSANADKPFECANYVAASQSCIAVSKSIIDGKTLISANRILVSEQPLIEVQISAKLDLIHGLACGTASTWDIAVVGDTVTKDFEKLVVDAVRGNVAKYGRLCVGYIKKDSILQAVNFSSETGEVIKEIPVTNTTFWKVAPQLRAAEQS